MTSRSKQFQFERVRFPPLEVCVRRPRCASHHLHGAGIRKPSQTRKCRRFAVKSALPPRADIVSPSPQVRKVPIRDSRDAANILFDHRGLEHSGQDVRMVMVGWWQCARRSALKNRALVIVMLATAFASYFHDSAFAQTSIGGPNRQNALGGAVKQTSPVLPVNKGGSVPISSPSHSKCAAGPCLGKGRG